MIEIDNVDRVYPKKERKALDGVSLRVAPGENLGLLGPNGAGKTTLVKLVCGVTAPTAGAVRIWGMDPRTEPRAVKRRIGVVHQDPAFEMMLTVKDNLDIAVALRQGNKTETKRRLPALLEVFELDRLASQLVFTLSGGEQKRLAVVRALMGEPDLLILDEPSAGLDVEGKWQVWALIQDARRDRGMTVIWTSHDLGEIEKNCDRVAILDRGSLLAVADPADLVGMGEADVAVLDVATIGDFALLDRLAAEADLVGSRLGAHYEVRGEGLRARLPYFLDAVTRAGIQVAGMKFRERSLEDAFVEIVSRRANTV